MKYLSVCAGIEAASVAWKPLGWHAVAFAEIDKFPCAVLAHHYPETPNWGDLTKWQDWPDAALDLLVGGTPCQSFSVAGLRQGLADPRGGLLYSYLAVARRYRPRWVVWENVPGVLSSGGGRDFGALLGALGDLGYGWAYRSLDAQYFGLAQRRERVFVVGHLGDWRRAAAVLFERESLSGHPAPRREAREDAAAGTLRSTDGGGDVDHARAGHLVGALTARMGRNGAGAHDEVEQNRLIAFDTTQITSRLNRSAPRAGDPCHPLAAAGHAPTIAFSAKDYGGDAGELAPTLRAGGHHDSHANGGVMPAVAFNAYQRTVSDVPGPLTAGHDRKLETGVMSGMSVRRLTPRECERLMGYDDDYTLIPYRGKPAADGPRYKALGNSMAVPVVRWIGERIAMVDALRVTEQGAA